MRPARAWKLLGALAVVVVIGGAGVYALTLRSQPAPLGLTTNLRTPASTSTPNDPLAQACRQPPMPAGSARPGLSGLWVIQPGSVAGYRAHEKFAELPSPHVAVARTERVSGWLLAAEQVGVRSIETGCVAVDLSTLFSVDELPGFNTADRDKSARDFLNVHVHPFAIFQPYPTRVDADISSGTPVRVRVAGLLEVNGVSKQVNFDLTTRLSNSQAAVAGSTTVAVGDYGVDVPQEVGGFVAVDPNITLEISLVLLRP